MSKKLFVVLVAVALVAGYSAAPASAQTISELQAQINALLAQLSGLQSGAPAGSAATCTFTRALTDGSSGADVTCLQNFLIASGHSIPAGATGYFGSQTKAAVSAWQAANGVSPAAGYFGPISQAKYNMMLAGGAPPVIGGVPGCPAGAVYNYMTGQPCAVGPSLPPGCTSASGFSPTTGQPCTGGPTPPPVSTGGPGILVATALSLESSPADGTDVRIGTTKTDIVKWKIKASNDDGVIRQWGIKATHRPWLYWSAARLLVDGAVVSEKTGLTASDFQEVTTGSDYRLIFGNLNTALPMGKDVYVVLQVDAVADTSRSTANSLVVTQATNSVVVTDATPSDNYTVSDGVTTNRLYDFVSANTGNIVPSPNTATPGTRWLKVSESGNTPNVTTQIFDVKAEQKDIEINTVAISASTSGETLTTLISSWDLYEGNCPTDGVVSGCTALAGGSVSGSTITFSGLHVNVPVGTKKTFTVKALFADEDDFTADGTTAASTTVMANTTGFSGVDLPTYNTATISGSNVTGGDVHAILVAPTITSASLVPTQVPQLEYLFDIKAKFSLTADGGTLYVSKTPATALATSTTASTTGIGATTSGFTNLTVDTCSSCGDTTAHVAIPDGVTRTFEFTGTVTNLNGTAGVKNFKIANIYFDDDTSGLQEFNFDTTFSVMNALDKNFYMDSVDRSA